MSTWAEIDQIKDGARKAQYAESEARRRLKLEAERERRKELGTRLVFAVTKEWRFAAHRAGTNVVAYPTSKALRSLDTLRGQQQRKVATLQALGDRGMWCGVRASDLLVALDEWREAGCPRRVWKKLDWETS